MGAWPVNTWDFSAAEGLKGGMSGYGVLRDARGGGRVDEGCCGRSGHGSDSRDGR